MISGCGRSAGAVIPALGSGRYSPGPNIGLPSWLKGSDPNCTINVFWGQPGALATVSYRHNTLYGNPCLKLLREEVECLVNEKHGMDYLKQRNAKTELGKVQTEIRSLQRKLAQLEKRKAELVALLNA